MTDAIIQVLDSIEDEASGPSYSVPRLCAALGESGAAVRLLTVGNTNIRGAGWTHDAYPPDFPSVPLLGRLRFSSALDVALRNAASTARVIHAHGLWLMCNLYPAFAARRAGKPFMLSPRGMLGNAALHFSRRKKGLFWAIAQGKAVRAAACLHATSEQEYRDIRAFGLTAPVAVIPNGIDVPHEEAEPYQDVEDRRILYLGRLHPKKGLDRLVDAWESVAARHPDWLLDIAGPTDSDYARGLEARLRERAVPRARLIGALYGEEKWNAYRKAELFVLPTLNENFAMTVAEALAAATPVICTRGAPWSGLETHGCGWWIEHGVEPLASALDRAMSHDRQSLAAMGNAGRAWIKADFDWNKIAEDMQSVYAWLSAGGPRPPCVIDD